MKTVTRPATAGKFGILPRSQPRITVGQSRKQLYINAAAADLLSLQPGDRIVFVLVDDSDLFGIRKALPNELSWTLSKPNEHGLIVTCSSFLRTSALEPNRYGCELVGEVLMLTIRTEASSG